jgi:hypothetical protein
MAAKESNSGFRLIAVLDTVREQEARNGVRT